MAGAVWTPLAVLELEDVLFYIRVVDARPLTARRIAEEFNEQVNRHAVLGQPGLKRAAAPDDWLYLKYKRWLVFYRPHPDGIEIMRVLDAVRDLPALF